MSPTREPPDASTGSASLPRAVLAWSSGKDAAFALVEARRLGLADVVALFTTVDAASGVVPIHDVAGAALARQVEAVGLPHRAIALAAGTPNVVYERRLTGAFAEYRRDGIAHVVFGDLFLEDIRAYRDRLLASAGMTGVYPLWSRGTVDTARRIVASGIRARVVAVDATRLDARFVGRAYDADFLRDLPPDVDPCGERGEFHTFVEDAPMMRFPVAWTR